jgi:predicted ATPase/serine phosphatase RsbU (regulator of sigma subunit)
MISLSNYTIKDQLYAGEKSLVFRGTSKIDQKSVIFKYLNNDYPTSDELEIYKTEYNNLKKLSHLDGVVKIREIENYHNSLVLVFEDSLGVSLSSLLKEENKFSISEFLKISIVATKVLKEIHKQNVIHKDIKPQNIVYNREKGSLEFIDFGSASFLTRENPTLEMRNNLEGTLSYIAPEQTGRMNRTVDYRADFYSLGITFYQLVTGVLPFNSTDPAELVHSHIAVLPKPPSSVDPDVPEVLSHIILKLIQKSPEDRYQTADGLLYDLEEFQRRFEVPVLGGIIHRIHFEIGTKDESNRFHIPEKLYGREREFEQILSSFERAKNGSKEILQISGLSGIGKTSLVGEIQKTILQSKGFFISGKYDKFKRNMPYRAIVQALQELTGQLFQETEEKLEVWKKEILKSLGGNASLITDILPELETIIGEQPRVMDLSPTEALNRFNMVFCNFLTCFCKPNQPLVIFLDDMQWVDLPSIQLLGNLLNSSIGSVLFIFSYRNNEINDVHPYAQLMRDLEAAQISQEKIFLSPLKQADVLDLVRDTLKTKDKSVSELVEVLYNKTEGNPFFLNELFRSLYIEGLLFHENGKWNWNIANIKNKSISNNVIDLLTNKISLLNLEQQSLLKLMACIGNWIRLDVFSRIYGKPESESKEDLVVLANQNYFILGELDIRFSHDKIREAVYTLLSSEDKERNHYRIGKTYLSLVDEKVYDIEDHIFTIVNQFNQSLNALSSEERDRLAYLNVQAGNKALSSNAYDSGVNYFRVAKDLLPKEAWSQNYSLCLDIYSKLGKLEYLVGNSEIAEELFKTCLDKSDQILEKINIYEVLIPLYVSNSRYADALQTGIKALSLLGVTFPDVHDPTPEVIKATQLLGEKSIDSLLDLPYLQDENKAAAMRLLASCASTAYITLPSLFPLVVLKIVNISLEFGNYFISPLGYVFYGVILCNIIGNIPVGYNFGKLAIDLIEKFQLAPLKAPVSFVFAAMINHWKNHIKTSTPYFLDSISYGKEFGNFEYAGYGVNIYFVNFLLSGRLLSEANSLKEENLILHREIKQHHAYDFYFIWQRLLEKLQEEPQTLELSQLISFDTENFSEEEAEKKYKEANNASVLSSYYISKSMLSYLLHSPEKSLEYAKMSMAYLGGNLGMMMIPEVFFFTCLSCISILLAGEVGTEEKETLQKEVNEIINKFQNWQENSPENYGAKYYILIAGNNLAQGNLVEAQELFEKAIQTARENEYLIEEALANELYAKLWKLREKDNFAKACVVEAYYLFGKWGCIPKQRRMETEYPYLRRTGDSKLSRSRSYDTVSATRVAQTRLSSDKTTSSAASFLDFHSVIKASQALASELEFDKLLHKLMKILFENAGAESGVLILIDKNPQTKATEYTIEAEGDVNNVEVLMHKPLSNGNLPLGMVNFVSKVKNYLVLDDAEHQGNFQKDAYILSKKVKSALCYPILSQGKLIGIVYLENNLTTSAFTPERIEVLNVLSSQLAISIENAKLLSEVVDVTKEKARVGMAMEIAREIQTCLLPDSPTMEGYEVTAFMQTADEVGGDYYDIIHYGNKDWIVIGDVSGHGIEAGLIMMMVQVALHSSLQYFEEENKDFSKLMQRVNAVISSNIRMMGLDKYMTITLCLRNDNVFHHAGAHQDIIVYRKATGTLEYIETPGSWLGMDDLLNEFPISEFRVESGDVFLLYTDGISEGRNSEGEMLGMKGLAKVLEDNAFEPTEVIKEKIIQLFDVYKNDDDITFMVVRKL